MIETVVFVICAALLSLLPISAVDAPLLPSLLSPPSHLSTLVLQVPGYASKIPEHPDDISARAEDVWAFIASRPERCVGVVGHGHLLRKHMLRGCEPPQERHLQNAQLVFVSCYKT